MRRPRRNHSPQFKAKVALAAIRGDETLGERFDLHANPIVQWKQQAMENMAAAFDKGVGGGVSEAELKELHAKISAACGPRGLTTGIGRGDPVCLGRLT